MTTQHTPHQPGEAPPVPVRDHHGVQQFASKPAQGPCPGDMIYDPATGECFPKGSEQ